MTIPSIGDIVSGDPKSLGGEMLFNHSSHEEVDVYIQDIYANQKEAMKQLKIFNNNWNQWEML